jgi:serine-type D-Ala-D-Ala carboxypeptidase/endopeptidase (penicillin-binding protein 4)
MQLHCERAAVLGVLCALPSLAQSNESLATRIERIMSRAEFAHADFGIEFYALDTHRVVYSLNANELFVPASTTKLLTEGAVLARLGADFRGTPPPIGCSAVMVRVLCNSR